MIIYLIKSSACLLLLLLVFHAFLGQEKMHQFNRLYLIFSLIFGLTVPLLTINFNLFTDTHLLNQMHQINSGMGELPAYNATQNVPANYSPANVTGSSISYGQVLLGIYVLVSTVLLLRFLYNVFGLIIKIQKNERISLEKVTFVLTDDCKIPHSFFKYVFVDKKAYRDDVLNENIITHEQAHAKGYHSLDIIFIELLKIAFWFNPILYFYKRAIQLNHEFLADEAVTSGSENVKKYQKLLLTMKSEKRNIRLTSSIHYSITLLFG